MLCFILLRFRLWHRKSFMFCSCWQMALTNYLTQSIICTTLFYSYGFGWYGKVTPKQALAVACIVYVIQVVWSHWWLKTYRIGPMERVWRWMTYGKRKRHEQIMSYKACPLFLYGKARLLLNVCLTIHRALDCIGSFLSQKTVRLCQFN